TPACERSRKPVVHRVRRTLSRRTHPAHHAGEGAGSHVLEGSQPSVLAPTRSTFQYRAAPEIYHGTELFSPAGALDLIAMTTHPPVPDSRSPLAQPRQPDRPVLTAGHHRLAIGQEQSEPDLPRVDLPGMRAPGRRFAGT